MAPVVPLMMYVSGANCLPSCPAQATRTSVPGPTFTPLGWQLGTGKLLITAGTPLGGPPGNVWKGSISSTLPTVTSPAIEFEFVTRKWPVFGLKADPPIPARATAPTQPAGVPGPGVQKTPPTWVAVVAVSCGPWWQATSGLKPAAWPEAPLGTAGPGTPGRRPANWRDGSGQETGAGPPSSITVLM